MTSDVPRLGESDSSTDAARVAMAVFSAVIVFGAVLALVIGRHQWFYLDEWDFLVTRRAGSLHDLLRPHNEHWSTLPILVYRAVWHFVGLRHYWPYQIFVIALHLATAVLIRMVMRRSGVNPWIATAAASLYALLGSGNQNILWAFQIGYVGSVAFGLIHLLLAVHDGPVDRRDWLGLAAGVASLMCSGVAVALVFAVAFAVLLLRGVRLAALHSVPLAVIYLAWWSAIGHHGYGDNGLTLHRFFAFVRTGITVTFRGMGQGRVVGVALGAILVGGFAFALVQKAQADIRPRLAIAGGLLIAAAVYLVIGAVGRPHLVFKEETNRYVDVTAALTLPAIAVAADVFVRRWKALLPLAVIVFVVGVPGNISAMRRHGFVDRGSALTMLTLPRVPMAEKVPRDTRPEPILAHEVTIGWLLDGVASGKIPPPRIDDAGFRANATVILALGQGFSSTLPSPCHTLRSRERRRLVPGQRIGIENGSLSVSLAYANGRFARTYSRALGDVLVVRAPIAVSFAPAPPAHAVTICG